MKIVKMAVKVYFTLLAIIGAVVSALYSIVGIGMIIRWHELNEEGSFKWHQQMTFKEKCKYCYDTVGESGGLYDAKVED